MPRKDLTKEQIIQAMELTKSVRAAARNLGCSYHHLRDWMKFYEATEPGYDNLFEQHKNQSGKGIPKFLRAKGKEPALRDIIEGRTDASSFSPEKLKYRLVTEGMLTECCYRCGFNERRVIDSKMPIMLNFKNKNKKDYRLENLEFLCYNCYYLYIADVFTNKQIEAVEDHRSVSNGDIDWELDDYHLERLKELGLYEDKKDDGSEYISYM
jgi:hypothetical protein